VLRISVEDTSAKITLALEGDLIGVWVSELLSECRAARRSLNDRTLDVDLTRVGRVDLAGEFLLALMCSNGAHLIGRGLVICDLIKSIAKEWPACVLSRGKEL
jgi:ABC-type transporter Mla MlaB component